MSDTNPIQHVSDTAIWVANYRAEETERPDALFRDPLAKKLIGTRGSEISKAMAATARYSAWTLVIRTRLIDELIQKHIQSGIKTVINLGAGLDTRPYRLDLPASTQWIEIDFPHVISMKEEKLKDETPRCVLQRIAVDLSDSNARRKLFSELEQTIGPAVVLTEGVVPYLTEDMVAELAQDLFQMRSVRFWIVEYLVKELYARFQETTFKKKMAHSPFRFFPSDWVQFFADQKWVKKEMHFLNDKADEWGRPFPLPFIGKIFELVFGKQAVARKTRLQAFLVLEKKNQ